MPLAYRWSDAATLSTMASSVPDVHAWWTFVHGHTTDADLLATAAELIAETAPLAGRTASLARIADAIQELAAEEDVLTVDRIEDQGEGRTLETHLSRSTIIV